MKAFATSTALVVKGEANLTGRIGTVTPDSTPGSHEDVISRGGCDPVAVNPSGPVCPIDLGATNQERPLFKFPSVAQADLDGDGISDLVVSYGESFSPQNEQRLCRRLGGASDTYANIVAADFDNDGRIDLAVASVTLADRPAVRTAVFLNEGDFTFTYATGLSGGCEGGGKDWGAAGDFGDGRVDIAVIYRDGGKLHRNTSTPRDAGGGK